MAIESEKILLDIQFDSKLVANAIDAVQEYRDQINSLKESQAQLKEEGKESSSTFIKQEAQIKALSASLRQNERIVQANAAAQQKQTGYINELKNNITRLTAEYDKLSKEELENENVGGKLQKQIKAQSDELKKLKSSIGDNRLEVGNYKKSISEAAKEVNIGGQSVGNLSDSLLGMINPLTGAAAGITGLVSLYASSAAGAEDLAFATDKVTSSIGIMSNTIGNTLTTGSAGSRRGFFSALADGFIGMISPALAMQSELVAGAKEALRELEIINIDVQGIRKQYEKAAEDARRLRDDQGKTLEERLRASLEVEKQLNGNLLVKEVTQKRIITQLQTIAALTGNSPEIRAAIKTAQAELRDAQEEINGKLTENITAQTEINRLIRERNELFNSINKNIGLTIDDSGAEEAGSTGFKKNPDSAIVKDTLAIVDSQKVAADALTEITKGIEENNAKAAKSYRDKARAAMESAEQEQQWLGATQQVFSALGGLFAQGSAQQRQFAITSIAADSARAVAGGVAEAVRVGFPQNLAAIATTVATVLRAIAQARQLMGYAFGGMVEPIEGFAGGGLSGTRIMPHHGRPIRRSNGDNRLVTVKTNEVILNERQQSLLGGPRTFQRIGVPGFADGGYVARQMNQQVSQSFDIGSMTRSFESAMKRVRILTRITDIQKVQNKALTTQVTADLR